MALVISSFIYLVVFIGGSVWTRYLVAQEELNEALFMAFLAGGTLVGLLFLRPLLDARKLRKFKAGERINGFKMIKEGEFFSFPDEELELCITGPRSLNIVSPIDGSVVSSVNFKTFNYSSGSVSVCIEEFKDICIIKTKVNLK